MRRLVLLALFAAAPAFAQSSEAPPAHSVYGVVTDAETGAPLAGAGVVLVDLGIGAITDRQGHFVIENVPAGTHTARAGASTYHLATFTVEKTDGEATALPTPLAPGAAVGCEVLHTHERPAEETGTDG